MNSYLGLCHAMAMPLCALYHMPHGQAVGMALPAVLRYNAKIGAHKIADIFNRMGLSSGGEGGAENLERSLERLEALLADIGVLARLSDFGFHERHLPTITQATMESAQRPTNPRDPSPADIAQIIHQMT
jgi:alcohol dehydrogenase class IV